MKNLFLIAVIFVASFACAQNAGNTGTFTSAQQLFSNQTVNQLSVTVNNIGQAAHYLTYCNSGFNGSIDIEASYSGTAFWVPIALASYPGLSDSSCHVLQAGGYFQYIRSQVIVTAGSVSAWYSSSSGPISFASPGVGSTGPASPVVCDSNTQTVVTSGSTALLAPAFLRTVAVCAYVITFSGATSAGALSFQSAIAGSSCGSGVTGVGWSMATTASTPQLISVGGGQGSLFRAPPTLDLCIQNTSGVVANVALSFARL